MPNEKWKCPKCGTENEAENNFCGDCGTKKPETSAWNSPNCGKNEIESTFSPDCVTEKLEAKSPYPAVSRQEVKNPAKFSGLLLSAAILFAVWGIVRLFNYRYSLVHQGFFRIYYLIHLSASILIFAKKEKWLFIPFGALSLITFVHAVDRFFYITFLDLFFFLFTVTTYVIITLESFKFFKNRRPSSVLSIVAVVTTILSTIHLFIQYLYMLKDAMMSSSGLFISSFLDIIHAAALILYLRWISKRKYC